jgi:peroxiredoxin
MTTTHPPRPQVAAEIPAVPLTTEGYSVLHQMMRVRWPAWRALPAAEKSAIAREASDALAAMQKNSAGQSALFSLIGHKGDIMLIHFRESFADLNQAELQLANLRLSDYLESTTSYLSIIELGLYESTVKIYKELAEQGIEPHSDQWKAEIAWQAGTPQGSDAAAPLSRNSTASLRLLLSYGPSPRRRQELVQTPH